MRKLWQKEHLHQIVFALVAIDFGYNLATFLILRRRDKENAQAWRAAAKGTAEGAKTCLGH